MLSAEEAKRHKEKYRDASGIITDKMLLVDH